MRISKKLQATLNRRMALFIPFMPSGHQCHKPGSQNRKKGASAK